jgi:radical SAM protein with 4Fe4S-binding SPASM domain
LGREAVFNSLTLEITTDIDNATDFDPEALLREYRGFCSSARVSMATFFVTGECPRKCRYCFVPGTLGTLNFDEIDNGFDLIGSLSGSRPVDILIYGGEPLLRPDLVERIVRKARDGDNISLATGGWPVPDGLAEMLAGRDVFLIVSFDGARETHNSIRPLPGGDSFESALKTYETFRRAGCRIGISMTISRENLSVARGAFGHLMRALKPDDMGLNPWMHPLPGMKRNPCETEWQDVFDVITGCLLDAISEGVYVEQLFRRLRPLVTSTPRLKDCPSRGGRLVFTGGGHVGPCDCMSAAGLYTSRRGKDMRKTLDVFSRLVPVFRDECLACPCVALCGGGCLYDAFTETGSLTGVRNKRCEFERKLLFWMLGLMLDSLPEGRSPGPLAPRELLSSLPDGILDRWRMPQPEAMLGGELR